MAKFRPLRAMLVCLMAPSALIAATAQPLPARMTVMHTPPASLVGLPDYPFAPHQMTVPWGDERLTMRYVDEGPRTGRTVLLLHGQPSWSYLYRKVIAGLVARGYRVVAPDLIGYGRSDKPGSISDYSYARQIAAMEAFVRALDLRDTTIAVHDWGGLIGLPTVAAMPDRFARIAVFNTSLNDGSEVETPTYKAGFDAWIKLLRDAPYVDVDRVISAQAATALPAEVLAAYRAPFPNGSYQSGVRAMSALIPRTLEAPGAAENVKVRAILKGWKKPVLIAFSEDSERIHPGQFSMFAALFPTPSIWLATHLRGTKHFIFEDKPAAVIDLLDRFASKAPPPPELTQAATPQLAVPADPAGRLAATEAISGDRLLADVATYVGFGNHPTGGKGSAQTLDWLERRLTAAGFQTRRQALPFRIPVVGRAEAALPDGGLEGIPAFWPTWTGQAGVTGLLRTLAEAGPADIAFVTLPYTRGASLYDPAYRGILDTIAQRHPRAIIAVTEHPTGMVVGMNVREGGRESLPATLLVGQSAADRVKAALGQKATVTLAGETRQGADFNLVGEAGPAGPALVITTPLNGWFASGGERGPGIAIALALAEWTRRAHPGWPVRIAFTTGHEQGGAGMRALLADARFAPGAVKLWINLGANIATVTPGVDARAVVRDAKTNPIRGAAISGDLESVAARAFAGQPGYATPTNADSGLAPGEIRLILREGNYRIIGLVGYQLLHHTPADDARSTSAEVLEPVARALAQLAGDTM